MIHMCYRCKALIDLTQAQEMIRSTPDEAKGTTYDNLCEYVKICQAAEQVRSKSLIMKHTEFGALVDTLEGYEIDIPVFYFRSVALQFCQAELRQSHLEIYLDSAACYIDLNTDKSDNSDPDEITFTSKKPQLRFLQPTIGDPDDENEYGDCVTLTFFNYTVLLLVKSDDSLETLQPLAQLCRSIIKRYSTANIAKWEQKGQVHCHSHFLAQSPQSLSRLLGTHFPHPAGVGS